MDDEEEVSSTTVDKTAIGKVTTGPASPETVPPTDDGEPEVDETNTNTNLNRKKRKSAEGEDEAEEMAVCASPLVSIVDKDMGNETNNGNTIDASPVQDTLLQVAEVKSEPDVPEVPEVEVEVRVMFNKQLIPVRISLKKTVGDLKRVLQETTKVAPECQKILIKGIAKDHISLEALGVTAGSKVLAIGSKLDDILSVSTPPTASELKGTSDTPVVSDNQNWCSIPRHQKIVDKGIPEDAMPGIRDVADPLPPFPLSGMVGSKGSKVRLTFKLEADELWIGTKERTDKVPIGSIRHVVSQPITGFEHYHIMAIQLGPTEASRFFIYWVPAQFIRAIKQALGA